MTTTELRAALIKYSPFLLKMDLESEQCFHFTRDNLYFNDKEIGEYLISDNENQFTVSLKGSTQTKFQFEISLDYKTKPVMLFLDNLIKTYLEEGHNHDSIMLIPKNKIMEDEKTEL